MSGLRTSGVQFSWNQGHELIIIAITASPLVVQRVTSWLDSVSVKQANKLPFQFTCTFPFCRSFCDYFATSAFWKRPLCLSAAALAKMNAHLLPSLRWARVTPQAPLLLTASYTTSHGLIMKHRPSTASSWTCNRCCVFMKYDKQEPVLTQRWAARTTLWKWAVMVDACLFEAKTSEDNYTRLTVSDIITVSHFPPARDSSHFHYLSVMMW